MGVVCCGVVGVLGGSLMVQDAQVPGDDLVFQHGAGWNVDPISVVGDDDDGALRTKAGG